MSEISYKFEFDEYSVDLQSRTLCRDGQPVPLTARPFDTLAHLLRHPGQVVDRDTLLREVWEGAAVEPAAIEQAIKAIRQALQDDARNARYVKTIYGKGYSFVASLRVPEPKPVAQARLPPTRRLLFVPVLTGLLAVALGYSLVLQRDIAAPRIVSDTRIVSSDLGILSPLIPDERHLYYGLQQGTTMLINRIGLREGPPESVPYAFVNPDLCDISRDRTRMVLRSAGQRRDDEAPVYVCETPNQNCTVVGAVRALDVTFTPDGKRLLFSTGNELRLTSFAGEEQRVVAKLPGAAYWPRFSPDGKAIRVTVIDPSSYAFSIWELRTDGTGLHELLPRSEAGANHSCGSWTVDGRGFLFQMQVNGAYQIWYRSEARWVRSQLSQMTFGPMMHLGAGPIAAVDSAIFVRTQYQRGEIVRLDENRQELAPVLPGVSAVSIEYGPGDLAAWVSMPERALWIGRVDGTHAAQRSSEGLQVALPRFSPDGKAITFMGRRFKNPWKVHVLDLETGAESSGFTDTSEADPDWSPNGMSLVFGSVSPMVKDPQRRGLSLLRRDTRNVEALSGTEGLFSPRWSPNGQYIAAVRWNGRGIVVFDVARRTVRKLSDQIGGYPVWSRDGQFLYWLRVSDVENGIPAAVMRSDLRTGQASIALDLSKYGQPTYLFGNWIGLDRNDRPLFVRDLSVQGILKLTIR